MAKFNEKTGWYVDWSLFPDSVDIYALVLKGTVDIQGLVALEDAPEQDACHIVWACVSPENNVYENGTKRYEGVGGHLFAIAGNYSIAHNHQGYVYGEAMDEDVLNHYINNFNAKRFPFGYPAHPYRMIIDEIGMEPIIKEYDYEQLTDEI